MSITFKQPRVGKLLRWGILMILIVLIAPLIPYAVSASPDNKSSDVYTTKVQNPAIDLWNNVRQRNNEMVGNTQMRNMDAGVLIDNRGQKWREYRMNQLIPYSAYLFGITLVAIAVFWFARGKVMIEGGRSGRKILRFTLNQRTAHWVVAIMFVLLGLTGIVLLYGRFVLIPILGPEGFSFTAQAAKTIHNYIGPAFGVALIIQFILFVRGNGIDLKTDINWLVKGGGLFGKHSVPAGCYNAGEKLWFWIAMFGGVIMIVSGLILDFPIFNQDRPMLEFNYLIHTITAAIVLAVSFGHIFIGTAGMEGAFEAMATGYCDENWAKEHHGIWYENMKSKGKIQTTEEDVSIKDAEQTSS